MNKLGKTDTHGESTMTKDNYGQTGQKQTTWSTKVPPIIPMKRWFLRTPLKTFNSSGFRELNSLNIC